MADLLWYFAQDDEQKGPVSGTELRQMASGGRLAPQDLVWREGMDDWVPAAKVKGLFPERDGKPAAAAGNAAPPSAPAAPAAPAAPPFVPTPPSQSPAAGQSPMESELLNLGAVVERTTLVETAVDVEALHVAASKPARRASAEARRPPHRAPKKSSTSSQGGQSLLVLFVGLLWFACGLVVLGGGISLILALRSAEGAPERTAAAATHGAIFFGSYLVARAGEQLAQLFRRGG